MSLITRDVFGPNDTITVILSSPLTSNNNINFVSSLVTSYISELPTQDTVRFSSFNLVTTNYNKLIATISITGITPQISTKPVVNNTIIVMRNGFEYNRQNFEFAVSSVAVSDFLLQLSNDFANSNSTCQLRVLFSTSMQSGSLLFIRIP